MASSPLFYRSADLVVFLGSSLHLYFMLGAFLNVDLRTSENENLSSLLTNTFLGSIEETPNSTRWYKLILRFV